MPVLGITGTGGSGKSSLTDELVNRFRRDQGDKLRIAVLAIDPTRRRTGGALLGDRIRMNAANAPSVFFRSLATRDGVSEVPEQLDAIVGACKAAGFDLVIVETPGIGQGDAGIVGHVDTSLYVMTPEFGAASQLEKIDMLDLADVIAINKFDRRGGADAFRDVRRQFVRDRELFGVELDELPVFGTIASRFNDDGVTALFQHLRTVLADQGLPVDAGLLEPVEVRASTGTTVVVPAGAGSLPRRDRRRPSAATTPTRLAWPIRPGPPSASSGPPGTWPARTSPSAPCRRKPPSLVGPCPPWCRTRSTGGPRWSRSSAPPSWPAPRCRAPSCRGWRCRPSPTTATWSPSPARRTCPAASRSPPASSR